ncbi:septum formation initiator family protein, partial [Klebsiella pneumoniae]|uniref:FtsB family cell division protein n=1 Tax=Klebsiella pneumoniae TaxID=573 RepID=UPI001E58D7B5
SYLDQRSRIGELRAEVAAQERDVAALKREKELWATDEYVEAQARQRLKFVKVGDRAYTVIDADPEAAEIDPEAGAATGDLTGPWYERLGDSLAAADARTGTAR